LDNGRRLSVGYGLVGALVAAIIGPFYALLPLILALPVVFLTLSRAILGRPSRPDWAWLAASFGALFILVVSFEPLVRFSDAAPPRDLYTGWAWIGVVALAIAALIVVGRRIRST
jgi:hypothetical protein